MHQPDAPTAPRLSFVLAVYDPPIDLLRRQLDAIAQVDLVPWTQNRSIDLHAALADPPLETTAGIVGKQRRQRLIQAQTRQLLAANQLKKRHKIRIA